MNRARKCWCLRARRTSDSVSRRHLFLFLYLILICINTAAVQSRCHCNIHGSRQCKILAWTRRRSNRSRRQCRPHNRRRRRPHSLSNLDISRCDHRPYLAPNSTPSFRGARRWQRRSTRSRPTLRLLRLSKARPRRRLFICARLLQCQVAISMPSVCRLLPHLSHRRRCRRQTFPCRAMHICLRHRRRHRYRRRRRRRRRRVP